MILSFFRFFTPLALDTDWEPQRRRERGRFPVLSPPLLAVCVCVSVSFQGCVRERARARCGFG